MEKHEEKVLLSGINKKVEFNLPDWNEYAKKQIKNSKLYKNAFKSDNTLRETNKIMLAPTITTNGWDTVSICRVSALNSRIESEKTYPAEIHQKDIESDLSLDGEFDPWQVVTGGDGKNVKINVPLKTGTFIGLPSGGTNEFDVSGCSVDILIKLQYFPLNQDPVMPDGDYTLSVCTDSDSDKEPIAAVINLHVPDTCNLSKANKDLLKGQFDAWVNVPDNLAAFDTLFATIMINNMGEQSEDFKWLRSTTTSYAYTDLGTDDTSIFGILCMTNGNDRTGLPNQLPAISLKSDENALFIISREVYVKYQLLPALPKTFTENDPSDFSVDKTGLTVDAKNVKLQPVEANGGTYYPVATKFQMTFCDTYIETLSHIECDVIAGVTSETVVITRQLLVMGKNEKGEKIMTYEMLGDPEVSNSIKSDPGIIITDIILALIAAIIIGIATAICEPIVLAIVSIIVAIAVAVIDFTIRYIVETVMASNLQEGIPAIDPMVQIGSSQVKWPFCCEAGLDLTNIDYAGALIFEGNLNLAEEYQIQNGRLICA